MLAGVAALGAGGVIGQLTRPTGPVASDHSVIASPTVGPTAGALVSPTFGAAAPSGPPSVHELAPALRTVPAAADQRVLALQRLLAVRQRAVLTADKQSWLATVDPRPTAFRAEQSAVFDNLRAVPFSAFGYDVGGVAPALTAARARELGPGAWVARVVLDYRIRDFDRTSARSEQYLTCVLLGGRWYIADDIDGDTATQVWDLGPVHVVRGERVLVLGTADPATLQGFADQGDRAVARVSAVWGERWPRRAVLVVPRTQDEMGRLLMRGDGLEQIAAVTTGDLSDSASGPSDRVVINPGAFARLGEPGRRVVLTHEMTHVAVRASAPGSVPIWLSEGFADYVGYQGIGLRRRAVAADVLTLVRRGRAPTQLPTAADFDPAHTTIAPAYSAAWLACSLIADRYGEHALVRLYRVTAAGAAAGDDADQSLTKALRTVLGTSAGALTASWRGEMTRLAAS